MIMYIENLRKYATKWGGKSQQKPYQTQTYMKIKKNHRNQD